MKILLIRHGQTYANENHLYCGKTDLPLSEAGAAELAKKLYTPPENARFLSSGLRRCNETLALLFGNVAYETEPAFQEMDFGAFELRGYDQLKDDPAYQAWITGDNEANVTPGGESGAQMETRVWAAFQALQKTGRDTVLVTHGGVIASIMTRLFPEAGKNRYEWQPRPGCGYLVEGPNYRPLPEDAP